MAEINYNVRQVTNYDLAGAATSTHIISVPVRDDTPDENGRYGIHFEDQEIEYKTAISNADILKLGYCCEPKGIIYPIFIEIDGVFEQINMGKECMYEFQPEEWKDANTESPETKISTVRVSAVQVPADIIFTLDYAIE